MNRAFPAVVLALVLPLAALAGCKRANMADQQKAQTWDANNFLPDDRVVQGQVPGTVAHGMPGADVRQPPVITAAMLDRGEQRFAIFCRPCHGRSGDGNGMIVERGFPHPPPLFADRLRQAKASYLYDVIRDGHGVMYGYGSRVPSSDRWAIVAYLRAIQLAWATPRARLTASEIATLDGSAASSTP